MPLLGFAAAFSGRGAVMALQLRALAKAGVFAVGLIGAAGSAGAQDRTACAAVAQPEDAIRSCTELLAAPGLTAAARAGLLADRGRANLDAGRFDQSIADLTEAIPLLPTDPQVHFNRGRAYIQKRQAELAVVDFTTAIRLQPTHVSAYLSRAVAFSALNRPAEAIADFQKAIDLLPAGDPRRADALAGKVALQELAATAPAAAPRPAAPQPAAAPVAAPAEPAPAAAPAAGPAANLARPPTAPYLTPTIDE